nr:MAG TPA: hypothetical protein [Caudoviricetes sp.]
MFFHIFFVKQGCSPPLVGRGVSKPTFTTKKKKVKIF